MMTTGAPPNVSYGDRELALSGEILRVLVGSTVHGLALDDQDDRDEMGICVEPPDYVCGLRRFEQHVWRTQPEGYRSGPGDTDLTIYSLRKYLRLAVAGNPTILVLLYVPDDALIVRTDEGDLLRALAPAVVSRQAGERFLGYLESQQERVAGGGKRNRVPKRPELIAAHGYDTKFAGHALRLGLQGLELMTTGWLTLPMPDGDRERVLAVRRGEVSEEEALAQINQVAAMLRMVLNADRSPLPERPDMDAVNAYLVEAHQRAWNSKGPRLPHEEPDPSHADDLHRWPGVPSRPGRRF